MTQTFEELIAPYGYDMRRFDDGKYIDASVQGQYELWQAAQASQREEVEALREKCRRYAEYFDNMHGTPCEQIRHAQEVSELRALVGKFVKALEQENYLSPEMEEALTEAQKVMA